ncbi:MAG TPA: DUF5662 family protein [Solirubrobacteraceae bacterium]|jgi:hypothetical protein|nr:DUF5662 family protein [Solirubrobacteraceae bacterium]
MTLEPWQVLGLPREAPLRGARYDSRVDTHEHIHQVQRLLLEIITDLLRRAWQHDRSKLEDSELRAFDDVGDKLSQTTYDSAAYRRQRARLGDALAHHYAENDHHPEHFEDGIAAMGLVQMTEMLADWKAATLRHEDGDLDRSITVNAVRFGYGPEIERLLRNTARLLGWL